MNTNASTPTPATRVRGCFLGGAVGDALGAAVEFLSLDEIRGRFGENGVQDFTDARSPAGYITDDTQMTLFTAEGMIRAHNRIRTKGICNPGAVILMAYYRTQGHTPPIDGQLLEYIDTGWLVKSCCHAISFYYQASAHSADNTSACSSTVWVAFSCLSGG